MKFLFELIFSYLLIIYFLFQKSPHDLPIKITFYNDNYYDILLCWISPFIREDELIKLAPKGCYTIRSNDGILLTTYISHRFLSLPANKSYLIQNITSNYQIQPKFYSINNETKSYQISFQSSQENNNKNNGDEFEWTTSYLWNYILLRYRHQVMVLLMIIFFLLDLLFPSNHPIIINTESPTPTPSSPPPLPESHNNKDNNINQVSNITENVTINNQKKRKNKKNKNHDSHQENKNKVNSNVHTDMTLISPSNTIQMNNRENNKLDEEKKEVKKDEKDDDDNSKILSHQLAIPRQSLKSFATLMMLLNHFSYLFLQSNPIWMKLGALPADLAGSSHIFYWLVGYNKSNYNRSETWKVLFILFLLEQFCRLPSPFSYESLLTIVISRKFLSSDWFNYFLLNYSILFHSFVIILLIYFNSIFNSEGLRLFQNIGFIYAISGRLFIISNNSYKNMLWLFAGSSYLLIKTINHNSFEEFDNSSIWQVLALFFSLSWYCIHILLFSFPLEAPLWKTNSLLTIFFSRYSLEIYVIHLFLAYCYHLYRQENSNEN